MERIESGDRAIDPLYPNFFSSKGADAILNDPGFSQLTQALQEACVETMARPPLHRALMLSDLWAAYDIVNWPRQTHDVRGDHARSLLSLLARFITKVAVLDEEIASPPHNYQVGQSSMHLPPLFDESSGWREIEWFPGRSHDKMGGDRHAARI